MSDLDEFLEQTRELIASELRERYSEQVIDHWKHPRNPFPMDSPDGHAERVGECGDHIELFLRVRGGRITRASFMTDACVTSVVSASMAVELATGLPLSRALSVSASDVLEGLGGLPEDSEHCAALAADTLNEAVRDAMRNEAEPWKKLYRG